MLETYDDHAAYGTHFHFHGLGAVLAVNAGTYDYNDSPKSVFAPGESVYFRATGEPNTGVLVQWSRDGIEQSPLQWEGVMTDESGLAQWRVTAGPSGIGNGAFKYKIVIPVMGVAPDPTAIVNFTVGATATQTTQTTTQQTTGATTGRSSGSTRTDTGGTVRCAPGQYYDALLGFCVTPDPINNAVTQTGGQQTYNRVEQVLNAPNACTPFGLDMAPDGRCIVPRTTTERYTGDAATVAALEGAQLARQVRELTEQLATARANAGAGTGGGTSTTNAQITALQTQLDTALARLDQLQGGTGNGGGGSDLPDYLQGTWGGFPKPLVIGALILAAFMFKK